MAALSPMVCVKRAVMLRWSSNLGYSLGLPAQIRQDFIRDFITQDHALHELIAKSIKARFWLVMGTLLALFLSIFMLLPSMIRWSILALIARFLPERPHSYLYIILLNMDYVMLKAAFLQVSDIWLFVWREPFLRRR